MILTKLEQLRVNGELPSPKGIALAIVRLTQREDTSLAELTHTVKADPAFVGRLIKTANGVIYGRARSIAAVQDAIQVLGIPAVRSLALSFSLISAYRTGKCKNFDYLRFWTRSLLMAIAFQAITVKTRVVPADEAFSVGLLARVGDLALATLFAEEYSAVLAQCPGGDDGKALLEMERQAFTLDHSQLSFAMLTDWGLPKLFTDVVAQYEQPEFERYPVGSRQLQLLHSLILAQHVADLCLAPESQRAAMIPRLYELGAELPLAQDVLAPLCDRVAVDWVEWASMLNLSSTVLPAFDEMAKPAAVPAESVEAANEAAPPPLLLRVLVAESDEAERKSICRLLAAGGHQVYEADDGQRAMELALELRPDVLIADRALPGNSGLQLAALLRKTRVGRSLYIILSCTSDDEEQVSSALDAGADGLLPKPLQPKVFRARLQAATRVVRMQQELERDRAELSRIASELTIANRRLEEVAMTDYLTRFPNRRYAMERMRKEWEACTRSERPLSCMLMDIDVFKRVNDEHGHDVGDAMLQMIADTLRKSFRGLDVICRIGGDEFLVICPDTPLEAALLCAERARQAVAACHLDSAKGRLTAGISIGVAVRDKSMQDVDQLLKQADESLYAAKRKGRNSSVALQRQG